MPVTFNLKCPEGTINIGFANWGRTAPYNDVCPYPRGSLENTTCYLTIYSWFSDCNRRKSCGITSPGPSIDPCLYTGKYGEIQYTCDGMYISSTRPRGANMRRSWWRHWMEKFSALLALCEGNQPVTGGFPSQRTVTQSLMISLICFWINVWANNWDAGDVTVMVT